MSFPTFVQQLFNGMSQASIYALVAAGITVTFGLTRLVNFAHGEIVAIGAYTVFVLAPDGGGGFLIGLAGALVVTGVVSLALERGLFHFTIEKPVNGFLVSLGLILVIQNALIWQWTVLPKHVEPAFNVVWTFGDVRISAMRLLVIIVTLGTFAALAYVTSRSWYGMAARAAAMDREMLSMTGVPVGKVITGTFVVGGMLGGLAGAFIAELNDITPLVGFEIILKAFAIAIVGGLGSIGGAVVVAVIFGIFEALAIGFGAGDWVSPMLFAVLVIMVLVRPRGLFRGTEAAVE